MITVYDNNTTLADLPRTEVERPSIGKYTAGRCWKGIAHGKLADGVIAGVESRGWTVTDSKFSLQRNAMDLVGAFNLMIPELELPEGQSMSLGLVASNGMTKATRIYVGTEVAVCHNGMATGQVVMNRRKTINFNMCEEITRSLDGYFQQAIGVKNTVKCLRETELSPDRADAILMAAGRNKLMPWNRISKVDAEYRKPTFAEHGLGTAWALLNAFTYVAKETPVAKQMDQINRFRQTLPIIDAELIAI